MATDNSPDKPSLHPPLRPPSAAAPAAADGATAGNEKQGLRPAWLWLAFGMAALVIVFVIVVLPRWAAPPNASLDSEPPSAVPSAESNATTAADVNQALQRYLQFVAELELINANNWGDPRWQQAAALANQADRLFGERRFAAAANNYIKALASLQALRADRQQLFDTSMKTAEQALAALNIDAAIAGYERALAIDAGSLAAQTGLASAQVREEVLQLMTNGRQAEQGQQLQVAQAAYRAAVDLDKDYQPAVKAVARLRSQLAQQRFRELMTQALTALDNNKLATARQAITKAAQLKPNDPAVRDAQRRLALVEQRHSLGQLREQADVLIQQEDWAAVIRLYNKALTIEANAAFAKTGMAHAEQRLRLHEQFDHYLADPSRLYSPQPLIKAQQLLTTLVVDVSTEPKLQAKYKALQDAITQASTPLLLTLHSDAHTDVQIYHVGQFGRFKVRELLLKPGTYTIVGARSGYRDVRKVVKLLPGQAAPVIDVRCKESI